MDLVLRSEKNIAGIYIIFLLLQFIAKNKLLFPGLVLFDSILNLVHTLPLLHHLAATRRCNRGRVCTVYVANKERRRIFTFDHI